MGMVGKEEIGTMNVFSMLPTRRKVYLGVGGLIGVVADNEKQLKTNKVGIIMSIAN